MKSNLKILTAAIVAMFMLAFTGCGKDDKPINETPTPNPAQENTQNTTPMTKAEYESYLTSRYDYYFDNEVIDAKYDMYDFYDDDFTYMGTYDEFIGGYNDFYAQDRANLEAFKKDLEGNYRKGDPEVDKYHNEVITSLDKAIIASDEYGTSFAEKTKDYGTYAKDEVIKGLRDIGRVPYEARVGFDRLVEDAKDRLGID